MSFRFWFCLVVMMSCCVVSAATTVEKYPNVCLIVVDDMGFSDLGCYGGEIETPNIDALAAGGIRFTQFYNTARCWSTRCALMTGYYPQQIRMDPVKPPWPSWVTTLPHFLAPHGYKCYHSGKWHVPGAPKVCGDGGFDESYCLEDHNNHFTPQQHRRNDEPLPPVSRDSDDYYSTTFIAEQTIDQLRRHNAETPERPFFAFTAFTAPHFPIQAPAEVVAKYLPRYVAGWDVLREARHERMRKMGIVNCELSPREESLGPPYRFENVPRDLGDGEILSPVAWNTLTETQQDFQATKMAIHAAMVDVVDREVGRIVEQLRAMNVLDNTLILFLSDNGASAETMIRGDGHNRDAELGSRETFLCLGPGGSTLSNTPLRRHKVWTHEGGISTPLVANWPKQIPIAARGGLNATPSHVIDVVPTIVDLVDRAALSSEKSATEKPSVAWSGRSLAPILVGEKEDVARDFLYFSHEGNKAIRCGDFKAVLTAKNRSGDAIWRLYDLATDRCEQHDLSATFPEKLTEMTKLWEETDNKFRE
ncbi:MAG: arylsulfatase [Thermoguttaceae bacterium]